MTPAESPAVAAGRLILGAKRAGERSAGNPPAPFDVAGAGDVARGAGLRPPAKAVELPPDPTVRAPALDPTGGGLMEKARKGPRQEPTPPVGASV